jgi:hypothetical protein
LLQKLGGCFDFKNKLFVLVDDKDRRVKSFEKDAEICAFLLRYGIPNVDMLDEESKAALTIEVLATRIDRTHFRSAKMGVNGWCVKTC